VPEVTANGVRLAYDVRGDGDPVLFIGGTGMPAYGWNVVGLDPLVAAGYRVVTFDSRGVGRSDGPPAPYSVQDMALDTADLIAVLDLAPCRVVGLSLGGFIAEELSVTRPDLVRCAVLWGSAGRPAAYFRYKTRADQEVARRMGMTPTYALAEELLISLSFDVLQNDDAAVEACAELIGDPSLWSGDGQAGQLAADFEYTLDDGRADRWATIRCPCLAITHEYDLMFPPRCGREAAAAMPRGEFVEIPGVAHGEVDVVADQVLGALLDFFART
jgi:pimeloyl-ACP methyl ester carboxylesterase